MLARKGESVLKQQSGVTVDVAMADSGAKQATYKGDLIVTNQRIVFDASKGLFSKKTLTVVDCSLEKVSGASVEGLIGKKLVLQLPLPISNELRMHSAGAAMMGEIPCKLTCGVSEPLEWERTIRQAVAG